MRPAIRTILIHQSFVGPEEPGGTRHYELASRLVANGHQFAIVAGRLNYLSGRDMRAYPRTENETASGVEVIRSYTYNALHRSFFWRVVSFVSFAFSSILTALRAGKADVIMGTTPPIFQAVSAAAVAFIRCKPFLLEVRDLWPAFAIDMGVLRNPVLIALSRWLERFLYGRAAFLLVNSPAYRDYLLSKGVPPEKISVVPNGVDCAAFSPESAGERVRQEYGLVDKFVVTYAGALGLANDIETLLRAARKLNKEDPSVHILLVGDGKERPRLEELVLAWGLSNITFAGVQPKRRMAEFLAASDACVAILQNIPMFRTTYPNKVFDYMAAGRPTILAIDGVIRDVIEEANGGMFVSPGDDVAMAKAIQRLSRDPQLCKRMGACARAYVSEHFDRNLQAQQFMQLIARVADGA